MMRLAPPSDPSAASLVPASRAHSLTACPKQPAQSVIGGIGVAFLATAVCLIFAATWLRGDEARPPQSETPSTAEPASSEEATTPKAADSSSEATTTAGATTTTEADQAEATPAVKIAPPPAILRPYEVQVRVSFAADPDFSMGASERITADVDRQLIAQFRQMWKLETSDVRGAGYLTIPELTGMSDAVAAESHLEEEADKIFLVAVGHEAGLYRVFVREWDQNSRTIGSLHEKSTVDRRVLAALIAEGIAEAFRPLAELEVLEEDMIEFQIRAGEFPPGDEGLTQFQPGDFLVPYLRYMDRNRNVRQLQQIPWTYLQVEEIDRSRIRVSLQSAFRMPLPTSRRRVEVMAMRIRPHLSSTDVKIYPRGNPRNPLVGYRCEVLDRLPDAEDPVNDRLKLYTDRNGIVRVPADRDFPLMHLYVQSGATLLARVPIIPGNLPYLEIEVPDDRARLNVEGEVSLLQGELIDIVATREVLMARARSAADKGRWEDVDTFLSDLEQLPKLNQFLDRIDTLRVSAVVAAQQARDRVAENRIKQLCGGVTDSAKKHLDDFRINDFRREMNALRR